MGHLQHHTLEGRDLYRQIKKQDDLYHLIKKQQLESATSVFYSVLCYDKYSAIATLRGSESTAAAQSKQVCGKERPLYELCTEVL